MNLSLLLSTLHTRLLLLASAGCPWCRIQAREAVYTPEFWSTVALLMLPLVVIALVGLAVHVGGRPPRVQSDS